MVCCPVQTQAVELIENPFQITITGLKAGSDTFVAELKLKKPTVMSAFDVSVCYDSTLLKVNDKSDGGYAYADEFKQAFSNGQITCNNKDNEKVVFAGACVGSKEYSGTIAKINFTINKNDKGQYVNSSAILNLSSAFIGVETDSDIIKHTIKNPLIKYELTFGENEQNPGGVQEVKGLPGDVDENGIVELKDAQVVLRAALLLQQISGKPLILADVDGNGSVTLADAQLALRKALLLIP